MKKFFRTLSVFTLAATVILTACKDEDSDSCENGTFEMTINGEHVTAKSFDNTLVIGEDGVDGKRMDIRATDANGRELIITLTDLTTGKEGNGVTTDDVYVSVEDEIDFTENTFFFTMLEGNNMTGAFLDGTLDITSCDANKKQVSGTFTFDDGETEASGSFTNMCYRIIKD